MIKAVIVRLPSINRPHKLWLTKRVLKNDFYVNVFIVRYFHSNWTQTIRNRNKCAALLSAEREKNTSTTWDRCYDHNFLRFLTIFGKYYFMAKLLSRYLVFQIEVKIYL
jgi:hypothetical protein